MWRSKKSHLIAHSLKWFGNLDGHWSFSICPCYMNNLEAILLGIESYPSHWSSPGFSVRSCVPPSWWESGRREAGTQIPALGSRVPEDSEVEWTTGGAGGKRQSHFCFFSILLECCQTLFVFFFWNLVNHFFVFFPAFFVSWPWPRHKRSRGRVPKQL